MNTKQIAFRVPEDLFNRLKEYSEQSMIPQSRIVIKAITDWLDRQNVKEPSPEEG